MKVPVVRVEVADGAMTRFQSESVRQGDRGAGVGIGVLTRRVESPAELFSATVVVTGFAYGLKLIDGIGRTIIGPDRDNERLRCRRRGR